MDVKIKKKIGNDCIDGLLDEYQKNIICFDDEDNLLNKKNKSNIFPFKENCLLFRYIVYFDKIPANRDIFQFIENFYISNGFMIIKSARMSSFDIYFCNFTNRYKNKKYVYLCLTISFDRYENIMYFSEEKYSW